MKVTQKIFLQNRRTLRIFSHTTSYFLIFIHHHYNVMSDLIYIALLGAAGILIVWVFFQIMRGNGSFFRKMRVDSDLSEAALTKEYGIDGYKRIIEKRLDIGDSTNFVKRSLGDPDTITEDTTSSGKSTQTWTYRNIATAEGHTGGDSTGDSAQIAGNQKNIGPVKMSVTFEDDRISSINNGQGVEEVRASNF
jgi:hypothetical protein